MPSASARRTMSRPCSHSSAAGVTSTRRGHHSFGPRGAGSGRASGACSTIEGRFIPAGKRPQPGTIPGAMTRAVSRRPRVPASRNDRGPPPFVEKGLTAARASAVACAPNDLSRKPTMDRTTAEALAPAPLKEREVRSIILGIMLAMLLAALEQTIVANALPTIGRDLGDLDLLPWVATAYL